MYKQVQYFLLGGVVFLFFFFACEPEEEKIKNIPGLLLEFSTDTIQFDTVITGAESEVRNITRRLLVYNPHDNAMDIQSISLAGGNASPYKLTINGVQASSVNNQTLLGGDSLLILVQLQIASQNFSKPYLVKDSILFHQNESVQDVKLRAFGQDAYFIKKGALDCSQTWNAGKAYVLKDTVWIQEGCKLTITKGAKIYFDNHAALMVEGSLIALGEQHERIIFSNSRLDIKNQVGLWAGIHFQATSKDNQILYSDIRNAHIGVSLRIMDEDSLPDLIIAHSKIENTTGPGIFAQSSDLYVYNSLINNSTTYVTEHVDGGNYTYVHCTMVNYGTLGFSISAPVVYFPGPSEDNTSVPPLHVRLYNNIIWSGGGLSYNSDLLIEAPLETSQLAMGNNLIRSVDETQAVNHNIISREPDFPDFVGIFQYNYQIDSLSPAIDKGKVLNILLDLEDKERDSLPDIGAFEYIKD